MENSRPLNILVSAHLNYSYMDATIVQGLRNLGHTVCGLKGNTANYLAPYQDYQWDLFIQNLCGAGPASALDVSAPVSIMAYGLDNHDRLEFELNRGFDHIFIRDYVDDIKTGHPLNFAIEDRYYCAIHNGKPKPLKDRPIDICFLGQLYDYRKRYLEKLEHDFGDKMLVLGPRTFNEPDDLWSKYTLPYCAHDPRYFEVLANSKVCLSLAGAGPDCARHWEVMASGGVPFIEEMNTVLTPPEPLAFWFKDYEELSDQIHLVLSDIDGYSEFAAAAWRRNKKLHSTTARAQYILETCGLA